MSLPRASKQTLASIVTMTVFTVAIIVGDCGASASSGCGYVSHAEMTDTLRLSDSQRGVIQLLATFSSTKIHKSGIGATLAAIREAEDENLLPFHRINMSLVSFSNVDSVWADVAQSVISQLVNNSGNSKTFPYTAVLGLNYGVADLVAASIVNTTASNTPFINPKTLSSSSLTSAYPNILHYKPSLASEVLHLVRFAFLQLRCANSDLHVSTQMSADLADEVAIIKREFVSAGIPEPRTIYTPDRGSLNASAAQTFLNEVLAEGMDGRNVKCVFSLDYFRRDLHELILADPRGTRFFDSTSLIHTSIGVSSLPDFTISEASIYKSAFFTATEPDVLGSSSIASKYRAALARFNANHSEADHKLMNSGAVVNASAVDGYYPGDATSASPFGFENYVATRWLLQLIAATTPNPLDVTRYKMAQQRVCNISSLNITTAFQTPYLSPDTSNIVHVAYELQTHISTDVSVGPLKVSTCPLTIGNTNPKNDCFCNIAGKLLYISAYSPTRRELASHVVPSFGVPVAFQTITPENQCSLSINDVINSKPTSLTLLHDDAASDTWLTPLLVGWLAALINDNNFLRTTKLSVTTVNVSGYTNYEKERAYAEIINSTDTAILLGSNSPLPFLTATSSYTPLAQTPASGRFEAAAANIDMSRVHSVLSVTNSLDEYALDEPPLVPFSEWNPAHISLSATFSDHIQSLVAYYDSYNDNNLNEMFTSIHVIVETSAQAQIVNRSLDSFQVESSSERVLGDNPTRGLFRSMLADAITQGGSKPFVLVGLMKNISLASEMLYILNGTGIVAAKSGMRFGLASPEEAAFHLFEMTTPNVRSAVLSSLRKGWNSALFSSDTTSVDPTTIFSRTRPLAIDTKLASSADIIFASHLGEWYRPRMSTVAVVTPSLFRRMDQLWSIVSLIEKSPTLATTGAASALYSATNIDGVSNSYGPFYRVACDLKTITLNTRSRSCQCAKGPQKFNVLSFLDMYELRASERTKQYFYVLGGCGAVYSNARGVTTTTNEDESLSARQIAAVITGVIFGFVCVVTSACAFYFGRRYLAVRRAPKDSSLPFAIAFTDIQSSTALWARAPGAMATSVDQHHAILRECVRKYNGYEVKTIGDSFMVAFGDADSATRFALGVQIALYNFKAWPPELDNTYIEILQDQQKNATSEVDADLLGNAPKYWLPVDEETCQLNRSAYDSMWKGLRVRVGVHFGVGEIKRDEVSDRFDYYGTVVNTAARVEGVGHGGQVLLTDEAFHSLSPDFNAPKSFEVLDLGPQPLRGLDAPIRLFQLTPQSLNARVYPPLRLDVEASHEEDDSEGRSFSDENSSLSASKLNPEQSQQRDPWSPEALAEKLTAFRKKLPKSHVRSTVVLEHATSSKFNHSRASPSQYSPLGGRTYSLVGFELSQGHFGGPHAIGSNEEHVSENSQNPTPPANAQKGTSVTENHVFFQDPHPHVFSSLGNDSVNSRSKIMLGSRESSYLKTSAHKSTDSHKRDVKSLGKFILNTGEGSPSHPLLLRSGRTFNINTTVQKQPYHSHFKKVAHPMPKITQCKASIPTHKSPRKPTS